MPSRAAAPAVRDGQPAVAEQRERPRRRAATAARRTPRRPGTAPAAARRSGRAGRCSTSRSSRWPRTGCALSRHSGASTDSRRLPLSRRLLAGHAVLERRRPAARCRPTACAGGSSEIQASRLPSGDGRGEREEVGPGDQRADRVRVAPAAEPSSGTATIARLTLPSSCRSCTHQISRSSGDEHEVGVAQRARRPACRCRWRRAPAADRGSAAAAAPWPSAVLRGRPGTAAGRRSWRRRSARPRGAWPPGAGRARHRQVGQAAVLVHPGPRVPRRGQQRRSACRRQPWQMTVDPAALVRAALLPPDVAADDRREGQPQAAAGDVGGGDGGRPLAEGDCRFRHARCRRDCVVRLSAPLVTVMASVPPSVIGISCPTGPARVARRGCQPDPGAVVPAGGHRPPATAGHYPGGHGRRHPDSEPSRSAPTGAR